MAEAQTAVPQSRVGKRPLQIPDGVEGKLVGRQLTVKGPKGSLEITLRTFRSGLSDADLAEAVTELVSRQGALEATMLANARIFDVTLADYLR